MLAFLRCVSNRLHVVISGVATVVTTVTLATGPKSPHLPITTTRIQWLSRRSGRSAVFPGDPGQVVSAALAEQGAYCLAKYYCEPQAAHKRSGGASQLRGHDDVTVSCRLCQAVVGGAHGTGVKFFCLFNYLST